MKCCNIWINGSNIYFQTKIHTIIAGGTKWGKRGSGLQVPVVLADTNFSITLSKSTLKSRWICINASDDNRSLFIVDRTYVCGSTAVICMTLNFHKKPQRDFVFHFFLNFNYSFFIYFFCSLFLFSARRCARNCVLAYRELRAWQFGPIAS